MHSSTPCSLSPRASAMRARQSCSRRDEPARSRSASASASRPWRRFSSASAAVGAPALAGRERDRSSIAAARIVSASVQLPRQTWTSP